MSGEMLNDGKPIVVMTPRDRIGHGPWARLFVAAAVGNEGSSVAERGRAMARGGNVHSVRVSAGAIVASVVGRDGRDCAVTFTADPIPPRVWAAVAISSRHNERLAPAMEGREQSVHLEHLMRFDWDDPLLPTKKFEKRCTCDADAACEHVAALAYVVADLIDGDPSLLLKWRGCGAVEAPEMSTRPELESVPTISHGDGPWQANRLPAARQPRPLPNGAVLMCLGPSDLSSAGEDLANVLRRAYASFAEPERRSSTPAALASLPRRTAEAD
jgi:uncharacterized Zn finger protein